MRVSTGFAVKGGARAAQPTRRGRSLQQQIKAFLVHSIFQNLERQGGTRVRGRADDCGGLVDRD
jgi:hypothetical protein